MTAAAIKNQDRRASANNARRHPIVYSRDEAVEAALEGRRLALAHAGIVEFVVDSYLARDRDIPQELCDFIYGPLADELPGLGWLVNAWLGSKLNVEPKAGE